MAFNSAAGRSEYTSSAGQTVFPFTFKIFLDGDVKVYLTPSGNTPNDTVDILTITTDYTVTIDGDNGGSITLVSGASVGDSITLVRELDIDRLIEYQNNGDLLAETLNDDQDYQTYLIADKEAENSRFIRLPESVQGVSNELPAPVGDAYFKWNAAGDALENDTTIPDSVISSEDSNLDAGSWANENEDVPVKEYTASVPSDRVPTVYSAKHWATKAQEAVIGDVEFRDTEWRVFDDLDNTKKVAFQVAGIATATTRTITMPDTDIDLEDISDNTKKDLSVVQNVATDADITLTADQNLHGRIEVTDTGVVLTTGRNVITDNIEHTFLFVNSTAQTLTVKTSAGTGIAVLSGEAKELRNDTVNVINFEAGSAYGDIDVLTLFNATGSAPVFATRAWVNFNGTGVVAIRASGNVSSITDNGTGDYTMNFITPIEDADYSIDGTAENGGSNYPYAVAPNRNTAPTTSAARVYTGVTGSASVGGVAVDSPRVSVSINR